MVAWTEGPLQLLGEGSHGPDEQPEDRPEAGRTALGHLGPRHRVHRDAIVGGSSLTAAIA
jgi:hypothetical protein